MDAPKYLTFEVTQEDIDQAIAYDEDWYYGRMKMYSRSSNCPVANALNRISVDIPDVQEEYVVVKLDTDSFYTRYSATKKLTEYIKQADKKRVPNGMHFGNHTNKVVPRKFRLRLATTQ